MDLNKDYQLILQKLITWVHELIKLIPNILLATIVLVAGIFISRWIKNIISKFIKKIIRSNTLSNLFTTIIYIFLIGITLFSVLSILNLNKAVTSILAGAGIVGLALAFAFQDIAANFISGIFLSFRRPIHIGDTVKIGNYTGKVEAINLRDTVLRTSQGQMVIIPNKDIFQNPIENFSILGKRRMDLKLCIALENDLQKVKDITIKAVQGIEDVSEEDEVSLYYYEFADSTVNCTIRLWVKTEDQLNYVKVCDAAIMRIKKSYEENGIKLGCDKDK